MTRPADVFARIAAETELTSARTVEHSRLGVFTADGDDDESQQLMTTAGPPAVLWRLVYLHYHASDDESVRLMAERRRQVTTVAEREDRSFVAALEDANRGRGYLEPRWRVAGGDGEHLLVRRGGLTLRATRAEVRVPPAELDSPCEVRFPKALRYVYPGCYLAIGDAGFCRREAGRVVRLYLAVADAPSAVALVRELTSLLNARGTPFQIKVMNDPERLRRRDCFVVYLHAHAWAELRGELAAVHEADEARLRDEVPGFALPLGRGWSFAEEPASAAGEMSFGQHRSVLAAEGLFQAFENGDRSARGRHAWILRRYRDAGIDVERPYLEPAMATASA